MNNWKEPTQEEILEYVYPYTNEEHLKEELRLSREEITFLSGKLEGIIYGMKILKEIIQHG